MDEYKLRIFSKQFVYTDNLIAADQHTNHHNVVNKKSSPAEDPTVNNMPVR